MPGQRLPMRKIRDVLRLSAGGMSKRKIAISLSVGATAAVDCIRRARRDAVTRALACLTSCRHFVMQRVGLWRWTAHCLEANCRSKSSMIGSLKPAARNEAKSARIESPCRVVR